MDIGKLRQAVSYWALNLNFRVRIHLFGSRVKNACNPDSDFDLALEFLDPWVDHTLTWMDYHDQWQNELSKITGLKIHLLLNDARNINIRKAVKEKSILIFESPEEQESDDEEFLKDLDAVLNKE